MTKIEWKKMHEAVTVTITSSGERMKHPDVQPYGLSSSELSDLAKGIAKIEQ